MEQPGAETTWDDDKLSGQFTKLNVDAPVFVPSFMPAAGGGGGTQTQPASTLVQSVINVTGDKDSPVSETNNNAEEPPADWECVTADTESTPSPSRSAGSLQGASPEEGGTPDEEEVPKVKKEKKKIEEGPRKEHLNIVFIGHVDAGKSTLGGQLLFLTGMVDKRTLEKYEREAKEKNRESWYLSWALDTNQEERDKGKTVECGRAYFETENKHFTLLDAPGHRSFVPNMIGGACQADIAVLVISARKGEFETGFERGGQTREHAMLAKTAGVKHLIVLINKMDDSTVNWSEERFNECRDKLLPYLKKCGFNPKTELIFMPCSGLSGAGLKDPAPASECSWYTGPCFLPYIDQLKPIDRYLDGPFVMPVVDRYKDMGTVCFGKVESGMCDRSDPLLLMPNRKVVEVLQLWSDEDEVQQVKSGENVKVKLKGLEEEEVSPGFVLCEVERPCKVAKVFDAQVVILEHKSIICPGYSCVLHIHAAIEECSVRQIICLIDRKTGEKGQMRPRFVKQDQVAVMRLETAGVVCVEPFKLFPQMGRFTLRDEGRTIAIGKVLRVVE
ncbi:eukaryotic peptide chain release factor GTP-binding subunit ERF3A-like [Varroa jacobsoni]|uniref:Tr-type G domain-containing protein n=1 Tax=Varroa destructor TaxID=109461 RepID=A0A7M7JNB4_VARDE|nr:eukaryotic peptide chain release factor GTP-binding subunit ERF3A-like [Varroa destructor]XP_022707072.1 eukaryotic peptide chain release factor GTP-binding subunit ERF3A-like [Varroa jacobsoni]